MAKMMVITASLWKTCKHALFRLYRREGPLEKLLITFTLILLFVLVIRGIVSFSFIYWVSVVVCVLLGWKIAHITRRFPAFTMVVFYAATLGFFILYCILHPNLPIERYSDLIILFVCSALVGTIRTFLREKNPHSPFLIVRIRNAFPKHIRAIGDSIGILVITALILLAVFYWEEVPKCIYNVAERKFTNVYDRIDKIAGI